VRHRDAGGHGGARHHSRPTYISRVENALGRDNGEADGPSYPSNKEDPASTPQPPGEVSFADAVGGTGHTGTRFSLRGSLTNWKGLSIPWPTKFLLEPRA
jgi:hypothetical protein